MECMANALATELREIAQRLINESARGDDVAVAEVLARVDEAVEVVAKSWSGSNMGYQSRVYYEGFRPPPAGAHFDSEWGFRGTFQGTTGNWVEQQTDDVIEFVYRLAGVDSLETQVADAEEAHRAWMTTRPEIESVLRTYLNEREDALVGELVAASRKVRDLTVREVEIAIVSPPGPKMIHDTTAFSQGFFAAPHQQVEARLISMRTAFGACRDLADIAVRAASHIERLEVSQYSKGQGAAVTGENVFIGHGRSLVWLELKDFVKDRMKLPWDEFNRVPVAGVTNVARLSEMLDSAGIAFVVLTAEDEMTDGKERARQNVVHEAGLFQGRLGFSRAIVLLEDGCEEFSNIQGLGHIGFPTGEISACFEKVRQVLEREGFAGA
jgi:predicted nucleotide-binding protein